MVPHNDEDEKMAQELSTLINRGRHRRAFKLGKAYIDARKTDFTINVLFQTFLASILVGKRAPDVEKLLVHHADFTLVAKGDLIRIIALAYVRKGKPTMAQVFVPEIATLHADDENRMALIPMLEGRIQLAFGNAKQAIKLHNEATRQFASMVGPMDWQWYINNQFHYLRAMAASGQSDHEAYRLFVSKELSPIRRIRAHLLRRFGRAYFWLDRFVEQHVR